MVGVAAAVTMPCSGRAILTLGKVLEPTSFFASSSGPGSLRCSAIFVASFLHFLSWPARRQGSYLFWQISQRVSFEHHSMCFFILSLRLI